MDRRKLADALRRVDADGLVALAMRATEEGSQGACLLTRDDRHALAALALVVAEMQESGALDAPQPARVGGTEA